ncbi:hypothetical protein FZEAL_10265 [Fusarium zealandicum]|uniref:Uncharacterized protein n=1 Tax=Fusarium zealandicum TaxID=1053134 RepID=A0A8H4U3Q7_9HYPO|nr:hypothetical protein FZEAL_10265 [Fusarium zealandicum]
MLSRLPRLALTRLYSTSPKPPPSQARPREAESQDKKKPLHLPGPESQDSGSDMTTLRVGESVRLEALGPLVVNADGSMGRVGNWVGMTEGEKEATLRLLGKRNKQRLAVLRAKEEEDKEK